MKAFKRVMFVIVAAVLVATFCLVGGSGGTVDSAAVVNGTPISEQKVTNYIQSYRAYAGYSDDATWASFLKTYGYTPADLREQVIDQYARQAIIAQEAKKQGISVSSSEVDDEVSTLREQYGLTDDDAWETALDQMGYSEKQYRDEVVQPNLLQQKLLEKEVSAPTVSDSELQSYVTMFGSYYSSDSWTAPTDGSTVDLSTIPSDLLEQMRSDAQTYLYQNLSQNYLSNLYSDADISIKPMPSGLPYDVDTENAEPLDIGSSISTDTSTSGDTGAATDSGSTSTGN